ncbi:MAG: oxaloacetate decarboxylase subunit alpha [Ruminococcaceae bacterium]|nr:oxaloacetate decarboxylase subunit alpha [Oscillospiraceae bacterium]
MVKKLLITETALRDSHQSLAATRMTTEEMLPILEAMDQVGYYSLEAWGGATFDACLRFLHEDPWARLRTIKDHVKNTKLQMLFRGQNILGYRHYADDVVEYFVQKCIANGIDIIRIFDALNDPRNLETAIRATIKEGGHVQAAISYTTSKYHTNEAFAEYAKRLEDMGAHSICIKDMSGLIKPYEAFKLVKAIKNSVKIPVHIHAHYTAGLASMTLLKAIEADVDGIDTSISPLAMGTSHAPTESMVATLQDTPYDTGLSLEKLDVVAKYFNGIREKYLASGLIDPKVLKVDVNALRYQVPGGMLSNLISQLKAAGKLDKLDAVLEEVARVREDAGFPPLVTPTSQIVGTQAVNNVLFANDGRYSRVTKEFKGLVRGDYGKCPAPIEDDFRKQIIGDDEIIDYRPADKIAPEIDILREKVAPYQEREEDLLSFALFEQVAVKFFEWRKQQIYKLDENGDAETGVHTI